MVKFGPVLALVAVVALGGLALPAHSAGQVPGMYSSAQAKRGASLYAADCAMCHGAKLEGDSGPSLAGKDFLGRWDGQSAADLLDIVANQMPLSSPGSLKPDEALAVVAYLLHGNGFAAGEASLDASHAKGVKFHLATK